MHKIKTADIIFRHDLYPRVTHNQQKALEYAECLELLPPIEINQHNELIDGFHRWTAHRIKEAQEIAVKITETRSDNHLLTLAIERNATHGLQLNQEDKKNLAIRFYATKEKTKEELVSLLAVSMRTMQDWLSDLDRAEREARRKRILELYLQCHTAEEIGQMVGLELKTTQREIEEVLDKNADLRKCPKVTFSEPDWKPPIYNVWAYGKLSNDTEHFGNTEQRIVENLLWLYTEPLDIVIDPFGGGGSTLDVCRGRGRRCWISDRKPKPGMEEKGMRTLDICQALPPLHNRWSQVSLVYLDPPYWRQAQNEYSKDAEDLANMPLDVFTKSLAGVVKSISSKLECGAVVALIIQPTQWRSEPKGRFTDHVVDLISAVGNKRLAVENRISCPYSTEQCTPQMVEWSKENKKPLVLSRELIIWRVG